MKKKIFKLSIYIITTFLILLLSIYSVLKIKEKKIVEENIQTLNIFCAYSIVNDTEFCTNLLPDKPILIIFMHPECDFCQDEIQQLKTNKNILKNVSILLITSATKKHAKEFYINQELFLLPDLQLLSDEKMRILDYFDAVIPSLFLYDRNKKLLKRFDGPVKIETLIKYLSE